MAKNIETETQLKLKLKKKKNLGNTLSNYFQSQESTKTEGRFRGRRTHGDGKSGRTRQGSMCCFPFKLCNLVLIIFQKFFQIRREEKPPFEESSKNHTCPLSHVSSKPASQLHADSPPTRSLHPASLISAFSRCGASAFFIHTKLRKSSSMHQITFKTSFSHEK